MKTFELIRPHKQISEIMRHEVETVREDTPANVAFEIMRRGAFRHLPVVDPKGKIVGVISDRDIRNVTIFFEKCPQSPDEYMVTGPVNVAAIMTPDPVTVSPYSSVRHAAVLMDGGQFSCLPVLHGAELVGIVTESDLMRLLAALLAGSQYHELIR